MGKLNWKALAIAGALAFAIPATLEAASYINSIVGVCDPAIPANCLAPTAGGALPVTGTFSNPSVGATSAAVPASATFIGANQAGNLVAPLIDAAGFLDVDARINGTGGATLDGTIAAGTAPTNGVGILGQYKTAPPTATNNQTVGLQTYSDGSLRTVPVGAAITDADGQSNGGAITEMAFAANQTTFGFPAIFQHYYNGATWDRARGSTSGAFEIIRDAAGNARGANVNASNQLSMSLDGGTGATVAATQSGTWTVQPGNTANTTAWLESINDGTNTAKVEAASTNAALADKALVVALSPNPSTVCTSVKAISQTTSTDLLTSTAKLHICSIVLINTTAQSISLVEGTGATCGTGTAALIGSTTAANGPALAATGGFSAVSERAWLVTQTTADHLCLLQSGSTLVAGVITYQDHAFFFIALIPLRRRRRKSNLA